MLCATIGLVPACGMCLITPSVLGRTKPQFPFFTHETNRAIIMFYIYPPSDKPPGGHLPLTAPGSIDTYCDAYLGKPQHMYCCRLSMSCTPFLSEASRDVFDIRFRNYGVPEGAKENSKILYGKLLLYENTSSISVWHVRTNEPAYYQASLHDRLNSTQASSKLEK